MSGFFPFVCARVSVCVYVCVQVLQVMAVHRNSGMRPQFPRPAVASGVALSHGQVCTSTLEAEAESMEPCSWSPVEPFQTSMQ